LTLSRAWAGAERQRLRATVAKAARISGEALRRVRNRDVTSTYTWLSVEPGRYIRNTISSRRKLLSFTADFIACSSNF
jgi:hypothetical protein